LWLKFFFKKKPTLGNPHFYLHNTATASWARPKEGGTVTNHHTSLRHSNTPPPHSVEHLRQPAEYDLPCSPFPLFMCLHMTYLYHLPFPTVPSRHYSFPVLFLLSIYTLDRCHVTLVRISRILPIIHIHVPEHFRLCSSVPPTPFSPSAWTPFPSASLSRTLDFARAQRKTLRPSSIPHLRHIPLRISAPPHLRCSALRSKTPE